MPNEENQHKDAPEATGQPPQSPATSSPAAQPKVEIKDGQVIVDGKKYVKESDLIAAKESLTKQGESAQATLNQSMDKLRLDLSAAQTELAQANARLEEAKKARSSGDISAEELSRIKKEAEDAKAGLTAAQTSGLDYRRKYLMAVYNIPANSETAKSLASKNAQQLDSFEEAIKAVYASKGGSPGNYALGGSGGGAAPMTPMDRARLILANTPIRGSRNEPPNNPAK